MTSRSRRSSPRRSATRASRCCARPSGRCARLRMRPPMERHSSAAGGTALTIDAPLLPGRGSLAEHQGKAYLAALGIAVPEGALARDMDAAKEIAARIGYPVALKAQAAALTHKSDAGGVALRIADAAALEGRLAAHRGKRGPGARRHAGRGDGATRRRDDRRREARSRLGTGACWSGSAASGPRRSTTCG